MTIPIGVLLAFAVWTILLLFGSVGVYRWSRILTGRSDVKHWRADETQGNERYRRAMRAHMNCVENLPVYTALVVALVATGMDRPVIDALALILIAARIIQSVVHIALEQTNLIAAIRFAMFFIQCISMLAMAAAILWFA